MHAHLYGEVAVHQLSRQRRVSWSQARASPHLPLSPGQELSLANRCNLGRLGQWRETCPRSFDLSSCFFLFCVTVLDSCLYFYAVVTCLLFLLPAQEGGACFPGHSPSVLGWSFLPIKLRTPSITFSYHPIPEYSFWKGPAHRGGKQSETGCCHLLNQFFDPN